MAQFDVWDGFQAAHVFPIAYEGHWKDHGYDRWITIQPDNGGAINSVQNGMLLRNDIHHLFDTYNLSINPDVGFRRTRWDPWLIMFRIIIRLCSLPLMHMVSLANILTKSSSMTPNDLSISFYDGTSGRRSWQT
jgi:hypothetical protein